MVDALAWVMGEQGAKSLRGGKMEDVIFAGTSGRPPLGRAEVLLTIDNSDGALPIEYAEVTISRTMFRSGGSEYAINGTSCRLLDVQELLSDSGIGREMHVIVGQGQLDTILHATPEDRRGFIEEAAGVLKHRKRKEKALRKLDATDGNLTRLSDLLTEIRRQLKPLGRQAEVARQAADRPGRRARRPGPADGRRPGHRRARRWSRRWPTRRSSSSAARRSRRCSRPPASGRRRWRRRCARTCRRCRRAQDTWFALSGLRERLRGTQSLAAERLRNAASADAEPAESGPRPRAAGGRGRPGPRAGAGHRRRGRDPPHGAGGGRDRAAYGRGGRGRGGTRVAGLVRAAADRREGLARLHGQVNALRTRAAAADDEIGRLRDARQEAVVRAERAQRDFTALETKVAGLDAGEEGLDAEHEAAVALLDDISARLEKARDEVQRADRERSSLAARKEALEMGLNRRDGAGALLAATDQVSGLLGSVAALLSVRRGTRPRSRRPSARPPTRWP